jgi:hypothetical protein
MPPEAPNKSEEITVNPPPKLIHQMRKDWPDGSWTETRLLRYDSNYFRLEQTFRNPENSSQDCDSCVQLNAEEARQFGLAMSEA